MQDSFITPSFHFFPIGASIISSMTTRPQRPLYKAQAVAERMEKFHTNDLVRGMEHLGLKTSRVAITLGADTLPTANIGEISFHIVHSNMIDIYRAKSRLSVKDNLLNLRNNKLEHLSEPVHLVEDSLIHLQMFNPSAIAAEK